MSMTSTATWHLTSASFWQRPSGTPSAGTTRSNLSVEPDIAFTAPVTMENLLKLRVLYLIAREPGIDAEGIARTLGVSDLAAIETVAELRRNGMVGRAS